MTQLEVLGNPRRLVTPITGDGAITWAGYSQVDIILSKATAAAITIAAPTAGTDDGVVIRVLTQTAEAHVVTSSVDGFNAKGSSGTCTLTAAIGNGFEIEALDGHWYVIVSTGNTVA